MNFFATGFALAGLAAAAGPIIIHLLNRRRYRVVDWAAMDFLREAVKRNRRVLQLRDIILLALRTVCVLLFGLALARPYFSQGAGANASNTPVHAVLVIDNSLSMGYTDQEVEAPAGNEQSIEVEGHPTLLTEAKFRAAELIEALPDGSRISVLPLCGGVGRVSRDAYRTKDSALEAVNAIRVVDRAAGVTRAAELAEEACQLVPDLPTKRVVFLSDQQEQAWPREPLEELFPELPEMQVASVAAKEPVNAWISSFQIQDGVADTQTDTRFLATVEYSGARPQEEVQVTLTVNGDPISTQTVSLVSGQSRQVEFPPYRFVDIDAEPGRPTFAAASVSLGEPDWDGLPGDNQRFLAVPVVAALPVVFIDDKGEENEQPQFNEYGATFHLRRLLAPRTSRTEERRQLVHVVHKTIGDIDSLSLLTDEELKDNQQNFLRDARLVVIAGVEEPSDGAIRILRQYVEQGGQLLLAAGGKFNPQAWTDIAWLDGAGILPAPLQAEAVGPLTDPTSQSTDFFELDFSSLNHDLFLVPGTTRESLKDLFAEPIFFKAVVANATEQVQQGLLKAQIERIEQQREFLAEAEKKLAEWAEKETQGVLTEDEERERRLLREQIARINPQWLRINRGERQLDTETSAEELARQTQPQVLADFAKTAEIGGQSQQVPFLIERQIGDGRVLFVSTGVFSDWSSMTRTRAVLLFDRIARFMIEDTLPERTFAATDQIRLPVEAVDRFARFSLERPKADGSEGITLAALGPTSEGFQIRDVVDRGVYWIRAYPAATSSGEQMRDSELWRLPIAVNGAPNDESQLAALDREQFEERNGAAADRFGWVERGEAISLAGPGITGHTLWWWFVLCVLLLLLVELAILAWPSFSRERQAVTT